MQQRLPSLLEHPVAFAHRGGKAHAPENTMEAFRLGLKLGATGIESDVWVTSDGVAVLEHDGFVRHRMQKRKIGELRRSQLPSYVPTLAELIEECGTGYHLSLDLKGGDIGATVIDTVREVGPGLLPRLWLCVPVWQTLVPLRAHSDEVKLVDSTRLVRVKEGLERRAATLASEGIHAVNMHHTDWNGGLVALCHRFGLCAIAWDLQHEHVLRPILRMGIDGVHSDWVDRMMDAYRAELGAPRL
jgi:glycerophosphoryl diester phosphodiesterase